MIDFPILWDHKERQLLEHLDCPKTVPSSLIGRHEEQAKYNHGQTLRQLAERGGLAPHEIVAVLLDCSLREVQSLSTVFVVALLKRLCITMPAKGPSTFDDPVDAVASQERCAVIKSRLDDGRTIADDDVRWLLSYVGKLERRSSRKL